MSTPAEAIADVAAAIPTALEGASPRARLDLLEQATHAAQSLVLDVKTLRAQAMHAFVGEVGARVAAEELGLTRGRIYQMLAALDDD